MRLITLVLGLAVLLWIIYTYQGSDTALKPETDKTVKQQAAEQRDEAKAAASTLQQSLDAQAKQLQQSSE